MTDFDNNFVKDLVTNFVKYFDTDLVPGFVTNLVHAQNRIDPFISHFPSVIKFPVLRFTPKKCINYEREKKLRQL